MKRSIEMQLLMSTLQLNARQTSYTALIIVNVS